MPSRLDLLYVLPALVLGACLLAQVSAFVTDDALITLRYALALADGHGLRWNANVADPVEGYSNFSHVLLGAAAWKLGVPPLQLLRAVNMFAALLACALLYALARHALGSRLWAGAAALLLSAHAPFWYWAASGLETGVYVCAVLAALLAFARAKPGAVWPAFVFLLAALTRFEGPVVFAACAFAAGGFALRERSSAALRAHARWAVPFVLAYGAYFAFRVSYFGHLLPNSAYYKRADPFDSLLLRQFALHCWPLLALAPFARYARLGPLGVALLALLALHALGFLGVAPSVAYFHRFFLPVVPGLALLAASTLQRIAEAPGRVPFARALAGALLIVALALDATHKDSGLRAVIAAVDSLNSRMVARAELAAFVAMRMGRRATIAVEDVGVVGYALHNPVLDLLGLNDEQYVHGLGKARDSHALGVLAREPELIALVSKQRARFEPQYGPGSVLTRMPGFARRYQRVHIASAPLDRYHIFIFIRRDQPVAPAFPMHFSAEPTLAAALDGLARVLR